MNKAAHDFMLQKTKDTWLVQGDANTKYFHDVLRQKHYKQRIYTVTIEEGAMITDYDQVINHFRAYYVSLLGSFSTPKVHYSKR